MSAGSGTVTLARGARSSRARRRSSAPSVAVRLTLRGRAPARDGDLTRADHLDQPERPYRLLERLDLLVGAGDLNGDRALRHVDHLAAEDVRELHHLAARLAVGGDLEQRELARHRLLRLEVADLDHVDELVELLRDLVDRVQRAVQRDR